MLGFRCYSDKRHISIQSQFRGKVKLRWMLTFVLQNANTFSSWETFFFYNERELMLHRLLWF